jgi:hypothetical protein
MNLVDLEEEVEIRLSDLVETHNDLTVAMSSITAPGESPNHPYLEQGRAVLFKVAIIV